MPIMLRVDDVVVSCAVEIGVVGPGRVETDGAGSVAAPLVAATVDTEIGAASDVDRSVQDDELQSRTRL